MQPNISVCHSVIATSFLNDGLDPSRPLPGIFINYSGRPEMIAKLVAHNQAFSNGNDAYPPIYAEEVFAGSLASSHYNMTLRLFQANTTSSINGRAFLADTDDTIARVCAEGHEWISLSPDIPEVDARVISDWRNADQGSSQVKHEFEVIRHIQVVCNKELATASEVAMSTVVTRIISESPTKIFHYVVAALVRFTLDLGNGELIDKICNWHSSVVNPNELAVPHTLLEAVAKHLSKKVPLVKTATVLTAMTSENCQQMVRPQRDQAKFITPQEVMALGNQGELVETIQQFFHDKRSLIKMHLSQWNQAERFTTYLEIQIIRLAMHKPLADYFPVGKLAAGPLTIDKMETVYTPPTLLLV